MTHTYTHTYHKQTHTSLFHPLVLINPFFFFSLIAVYQCCVCVCARVVDFWVCGSNLLRCSRCCCHLLYDCLFSTVFSSSSCNILQSFFEQEMHNSGEMQHPDSRTVTQSSHTKHTAYKFLKQLILFLFSLNSRLTETTWDGGFKKKTT